MSFYLKSHVLFRESKNLFSETGHSDRYDYKNPLRFQSFVLFVLFILPSISSQIVFNGPSIIFYYILFPVFKSNITSLIMCLPYKMYVLLFANVIRCLMSINVFKSFILNFCFLLSVAHLLPCLNNNFYSQNKKWPIFSSSIETSLAHIINNSH